MKEDLQQVGDNLHFSHVERLPEVPKEFCALFLFSVICPQDKQDCKSLHHGLEKHIHFIGRQLGTVQSRLEAPFNI